MRERSTRFHEAKREKKKGGKAERDENEREDE